MAQARLTFPSGLASSSSPTLARIIFCSVVMVVETWFTRTTASAFYRLLTHLTNVAIPQDAGDFRQGATTDKEGRTERVLPSLTWPCSSPRLLR